MKIEIQFHHSLEDMLSMLRMRGIVRGKDQEIIHVNDKPPFGNHIVEGIIHESLEGGRGIIHAEEHDHRFKEAFMDNEGTFPLISFFDVNIVITPSNVEFGEDLSSFEFIDEVRDEEKRIGIAGGMGIEISVVLARTEFAILLFHKEERGGLRGFGGSNLSAVKVFF
jgi:hypothetical protein